jgi:CBS domain-containing protein
MDAGSIMRSPFASVHPEHSVLQAARLMVEGRLYALPVLDEAQRVIGVLDITDLIGLLLPAYLDEVEDLSFLPGSFAPPETTAREWAALTVRELLARHQERLEPPGAEARRLHCVQAGESVLEVARLFVREGAHKCPVVEEGRVVGVIDPQDLLQAVIADAAEGTAE